MMTSMVPMFIKKFLCGLFNYSLKEHLTTTSVWNGESDDFPADVITMPDLLVEARTDYTNQTASLKFLVPF